MAHSSNYKRNKITVEYRQHVVSKRYLEGKLIEEIADELGVAKNTVNEDLKTCRAFWREKHSREFNERLHEELAKIDKLEVMATEAWYDSRKNGEMEECTTVNGKKPNAGNKGRRIVSDKVLCKKKVTIMGRYGDARFLSQIQWCIEKRLELMGLSTRRNILNNNNKDTVIFDWDTLRLKSMVEASQQTQQPMITAKTLDPLEQKIREMEEKAAEKESETLVEISPEDKDKALDKPTYEGMESTNGIHLNGLDLDGEE